MQSRLDRIDDWEQRAEASGYCACKMAEQLGVTRRFLQIYFQYRFGTAPREWMLCVRMTRAAGLLTGGVAVKVVSVHAAYKQVSHFSREFKRFFGVCPSGYVIGPVTPASRA